MVRQLQLTTRCASTMEAGSTLTGLLHGRRHTPTPLLLPSRVPKDTTCPWTALALPDSIHPSKKTTYADVLRAPPPRRKRLHRLARRGRRVGAGMTKAHQSHGKTLPLFSVME